jgi:hypothetical protein
MPFRPFLYDSDADTPYILVAIETLPRVVEMLQAENVDFFVSQPQQGTCKVQFPNPPRERLMKILARIAAAVP